MNVGTSNPLSYLPPLLLLGTPCGEKGERLATVEETEAGYMYNPVTQRTQEPLECKGATYTWVSTGKGDKSEKRRQD